MTNELDDLKAENKLLRVILALRAGRPGMYHDDGELSDATMHPFIDFKRDSAEEIEAKLMERGRKTLASYREGEVTIDYTNWQGVRGLRRILPKSLDWGKNQWHPEDQWLLVATDLEKSEPRTFAVKDIHSWNGSASTIYKILAWMSVRASPIDLD